MEYAGYVRRGAPTDWSKVTGDIAQRIGAVEESREKERDKLEKLFADTTKVIGDVEMGMNPEFNETILYTADKARDLVYDAYKKLKSGQMSPREYRNIQNNVQARWAEYDTAVKQKNNRFAEIEKRTREGTNSEMELWQNKKAAEMAAFKEYSLEWGSNGNLVYAKRDDKGNIIPGSVMPISALNKTPNVLVDRFNLTEKVGKYKKNFGAFEIEEGGFILGGAAVEEKFNKAKESVIGSLYTNDNDYGRALVDSGYDNFVLYQEGEEVPEGTTEDGTPLAIKMVLDKKSKTWTAVPTEKQKAYARRMAGQAIDTMVGYKKRKVKQPSTKDTKYKKTSMLNYELAVSASKGNNLDRLVGFDSGDYVIQNAIDQGDNIRLTLVKGQGDKQETAYRNVPKGDAIKMMQYVDNSKTYSAAKTSFDEGRKIYMAAHDGKEFTVEEAALQPLPRYEFAALSDDEKESKIKKYRKLQTLNADDEDNEKTIISDLQQEILGEIDFLGGRLSTDDIKITLEDNEIKINIPGSKEEFNIDVDYKDWILGIGSPTPQKMAKTIENIVNAYIDQENKQRESGKAEEEKPTGPKGGDEKKIVGGTAIFKNGKWVMKK